MRTATDSVVLSDLHLGPSPTGPLFFSGDALAAFLRSVRESSTREVIIAGDFIDFLVPLDRQQLTDFDEARAVTFVKVVAQTHAEVFRELGLIGASSKHELVIMAGNHDPELALPAVQRVIEEELTARLPADGADRPVRVEWRVFGEAITLSFGGRRVLIEHGDMYDPWNHIDREAYRRVLLGTSRGLGLKAHAEYMPPPGTRLVREMLPIVRKRGYTWVDLIKPERESLFPLLGSMLPPRERFDVLKLLAPLAGKAYLRSAIDKLRALVGETPFWAGDDDDRRHEFDEWLERTEREELGLVEVVDSDEDLITRLRRVSRDNTFFMPTAEDLVVNDVSFLVDQGADVVVLGHTHAAKAYPVQGKQRLGLYLNSGTWANLLKLPSFDDTQEEWSRFLGLLRSSGATGQPRLTFVRLRRQDTDCLQVELREWKTGEPSRLVRHYEVRGAGPIFRGGDGD